MLQNLLKVFNGYWRMDFPDWVGDTCWGFIIKTYIFSNLFSSVILISLPLQLWLFQTKFTSQHGGGGILLAFWRRRHFLWSGGSFSSSTVSTHLFQLKATVLTIFLRVVKRNILFFPTGLKEQAFHPSAERALFWRWFLRMPRFLIFRENLKSLKLMDMGGQSESAYISLELKIAILLLLTFQHWSVFSWKTSKVPRKT